MGREGQATGPGGREQCPAAACVLCSGLVLGAGVTEPLREAAGQVVVLTPSAPLRALCMATTPTLPRPQVDGVNKKIPEAIDSFRSESRCRRPRPLHTGPEAVP